jgi:hypothetical protein
MPLDIDALLANKNIPRDTKRRLLYGVIEQPDGEGKTKFVHDPGIREGRLSSLSVDRGRGHVSETLLRAEQADSGSPNSEVESMRPGPARDALGRFSRETRPGSPGPESGLNKRSRRGDSNPGPLHYE